MPSPAKSRGLCDNGASSDAMDRGRSGLRHGSSIGRGAAALALALVWPLGALCCPIALAGAFTDGGAAFFAGAFAVGVAAACALAAVVRGGGETGRAGLPTPRPFAPVLARLAPLLLVAGVAAVAFLCATGVPVSSPLAFACGGAAGVGEGAALLATGLSFVGLDLPRLVRAVGSSVAGAAGLLAPLLLLGRDALSTWWYLACVSLAAGVLAAVTAPTAAPAAAAAPPCEPFGPFAPLAEPAPAPLPCAPVSSLTHPFVCLRAGLWEPALGLGLSLMSTLLPWGAFFSGGPASTPAPWTFCAGLLLAGALCLVAARSPLARGPLEPVMHVAMPVLAAAVVGLRMLGDVTDASGVLAAAKGIASGATAAFFFVFAWLAMAAAPRLRPRDPRAPFEAGLALAFGVAASILPLHALSQQAAALAAPALSLAFLVAASCSSLGFERARVHGVRAGSGDALPTDSAVPQVSALLGVEEAAARLATERGLSPREGQVLAQLASGRSAEGIAEVLGISPHTVRAHVRRIHEKLQVSSRDEVVDAIEAVRKGD